MLTCLSFHALHLTDVVCSILLNSFLALFLDEDLYSMCLYVRVWGAEGQQPELHLESQGPMVPAPGASAGLCASSWIGTTGWRACVPVSQETQASDSKCQAEAGGTRGQSPVPMVQHLRQVWVCERVCTCQTGLSWVRWQGGEVASEPRWQDGLQARPWEKLAMGETKGVQLGPGSL